MYKTAAVIIGVLALAVFLRFGVVNQLPTCDNPAILQTVLNLHPGYVEHKPNWQLVNIREVTDDAKLRVCAANVKAEYPLDIALMPSRGQVAYTLQFQTDGQVYVQAQY